MAATLKDVAEQAGVSIATVSRVLNDPEKVAEQSRRKVLDAVEALGYSSNLLAKSLRQDGLNAVYVLLPSLSDPFFAQMHQGISDVLASYDYFMLSVTTEGDRKLEKECLTKAKAMGPSGVLIYTPNDPVPEEWNSFSSSFPILFLSGNAVEGKSHMTSLLLDRRKAGMQAVDALVETGRRNFLYLCDNNNGVDGEFWKGIQEAGQAQGCTCQLQRAGRSAGDAGKELEKFWEQTDSLPDSILTQNSAQAAGVLSFLQRRNIPVPEQISVLSFENTELTCFLTPPVSVIGPAGYQVGMMGAKRLLEWIHMPEEDTACWQEGVDLIFIPRRSTDVRS